MCFHKLPRTSTHLITLHFSFHLSIFRRSVYLLLNNSTICSSSQDLSCFLPSCLVALEPVCHFLSVEEVLSHPLLRLHCLLTNFMGYKLTHKTRTDTHRNTHKPARTQTHTNLLALSTIRSEHKRTCPPNRGFNRRTGRNNMGWARPG